MKEREKYTGGVCFVEFQVCAINVFSLARMERIEDVGKLHEGYL